MNRSYSSLYFICICFGFNQTNKKCIPNLCIYIFTLQNHIIKSTPDAIRIVFSLGEISMLLRFEKHEESFLTFSPSSSHPPSPRDNHQVMLISHHKHFSFPPLSSLSLSFLCPSVICHPRIYRIKASSFLCTVFWPSAGIVWHLSQPATVLFSQVINACP